MPNAPTVNVNSKHRKRKNRHRRNRQEQIAAFAKKKTLERMKKNGCLPKIAEERL
jgi:hypothetical protein